MECHRPIELVQIHFLVPKIASRIKLWLSVLLIQCMVLFWGSAEAEHGGAGCLSFSYHIMACTAAC